MKSRKWITLNLVGAGLIACHFSNAAMAAPTFNPGELLNCKTFDNEYKNRCDLPATPVVSLDFGSDVTVSYRFVCPEVVLYSPFGLSASTSGDALQPLTRANTTVTFKNVKNLYFAAQNPLLFQTKTTFEKSCSIKIVGLAAVPSDAQIGQWKSDGAFHVQILNDGIELLALAVAFESNLTVTKNDLNLYIDSYWSQFIENFNVMVIEDQDTMQGHFIEEFVDSINKRVKNAEQMKAEGIYEVWEAISLKYPVLTDFFGIVNGLKAKVMALNSPFKPYKMTPEEAATWQRLNGNLVQYQTANLANRKTAAQAFLDLLKSQEEAVKAQYTEIMKQIEDALNAETPN